MASDLVGATLTIVGRNKEKTAQVLEELREASRNPQLDFLKGLTGRTSAQEPARH